MISDIYPVVLAVLIVLASVISIKWSISISIVEIILGIIAGNLGLLEPESWMIYVASIGGMVLTFLAGTEVNPKLMKDNLKECLMIGVASFLISFVLVFIVCEYMLLWPLTSSLLVATALSETSIAIVYSIILDKELSGKKIGTILMGSTFVTNICTAFALSALFMKPTMETLVFVIASVIILVFSYKYSDILFESQTFSMTSNQLELKYIFLLLVLLIFFATLGGGQALLPVFILGAILSKPFSHTNKNNMLKRLQTVAFTVITPIFFIVNGSKVSIPVIIGALGVFLLIFVVRQIGKFIGVYTIVKTSLSKYHMYITMVMSTGLTFGLVAASYGLNNNIISSHVYSILTGVLVLSAIIPSIIGNKYFAPTEEDLKE
ncbi:MAG: cation:proton antiporter [Methanosphaera sp.]